MSEQIPQNFDFTLKPNEFGRYELTREQALNVFNAFNFMQKRISELEQLLSKTAGQA